MKPKFWIRWCLWFLPLLFAMLLPLLIGHAANDFYTHGSFPSAGSPATSASMRAELDTISAGFDKLPVLTGNGNKVVLVNAGGTALTVGQQLIMGGNLTISGAFATTITVTGTTTVTLPTSGTLATLAGIETLTNKTFSLGSNTISGTTTQFNSALSDNDFATLAGIETLTNKTLTAPGITAPNITGTVSGGATYSGVSLDDPKILLDNVVTIDNFATTDLCATTTGAIDVIGATVTTLIVNKAVTCTLDKTAPSTLTLQFTGQGVVTVSTTKTLTIDGPLIAADKQIFTLTGTGTVRFGNSGLVEVRAIWYGLTLDNTGDNTAALQAAMDATLITVNSTRPVRVVLPRGIIRYSSTLYFIQSHIEVVGAGNGFGEIGAQSILQNGNAITTLNYVGSGVAIKQNSSYAKFSGWAVTTDSNGAGATTATGGWQVGDPSLPAAYSSWANTQVISSHYQDLTINNFKTTNAWGMKTDPARQQAGSYFEHVSFVHNYDNYVEASSGSGFNTDTTFVRCNWEHAIRYGFSKESGGTNHSFYFFSNRWQHNGADAFHVDGGAGWYRLFSPYFEDNNLTTAGYTVEFDSQVSIVGTPSSYQREISLYSPIFAGNTVPANTSAELYVRNVQDFSVTNVGMNNNQPFRVERNNSRTPGYRIDPRHSSLEALGSALGILATLGAANTEGLWTFNKFYGANMANGDWGVNNLQGALVDGAATSIDGTMDPRYNGGPLSLFFDGTSEWQVDDNANFSFVGTAMTVVALVQFNYDPSTQLVYPSQTVLAKYDDTGAREYRLYLDASRRLVFEAYDESATAFIARYGSSTTAFSGGTWYPIIATYDGSANATGIHLYVGHEAAAFDDTSSTGGTYVAMENLAAKPANYQTVSAVKAQRFRGDAALMMLVQEDWGTTANTYKRRAAMASLLGLTGQLAGQW